MMPERWGQGRLGREGHGGGGEGQGGAVGARHGRDSGGTETATSLNRERGGEFASNVNWFRKIKNVERDYLKFLARFVKGLRLRWIRRYLYILL